MNTTSTVTTSTSSIRSISLILYTPALAFVLYVIINLRTLYLNRNRPKLPPGPKPRPFIGNLGQLGSKPHQTLAAMARTYGPLMYLRLGFVDVVVAATAEVAEQFLKTHDLNFSSRPPNAGAKYMAYNYQDLVFAPYGARWRMLRKICSVHIFSAKALDDYRHVREVSRLILVYCIYTRNLNTCMIYKKQYYFN